MSKRLAFWYVVVMGCLGSSALATLAGFLMDIRLVAPWIGGSLGAIMVMCALYLSEKSA